MHILSNRWISAVTIVVLFCYVFDPSIFFLDSSYVGTLDPDSDQYLEFAGWLIGRSVRTIGELTTFVPGHITRTPVYPIFLIPALLVPHAYFIKAILWTGLFVWIAVTFVLVQTFKNFVRPATIIILCLTVSILMKHYPKVIMTEWLVYLLLLLLAALWQRFFSEPRSTLLFFVTCTSTLLTLTRPEYGFILLMPPLMVVLSKFPIRSALLPITAGVLPLILWLGFNFYRFDRITVAPMEGHIFASASVLGDVVPDAAVPALQKEFTTAMNERLIRREADAASTLVTLNPDRLIKSTSANLFTAERFGDTHDLSWLTLNDMMARYAAEAIAAHPFAYLELVFWGISSLIWSLPSFVLSLLIFRRWRDRPKMRPLQWTTLGAYVLHGIHIVLIAFLNIVYFRYYLPTLSLVLFMTLLNVFADEN